MDIVPALLYVLLRAVNAVGLAQADAPVPEPPALAAPCDPGFGFPRPSATCPDDDPLIGQVTAYDVGRVTVQPVRVFTHDAEGRAYAEAHGLEYPFSNDVYSVEIGRPRQVRLAAGTLCSGSILVAYGEPLADNRVDCAAFGTALAFHGFGIPAALWFDGDRLVQLSELYRP